MLTHREGARRAADAGFSLVELLVVITIIGILATAVTVKVMGSLSQARVTRAQADIAKMRDAVGIYKMLTGKLPEAMSDLTKEIPPHYPDGLIEGAKDGAVKDPWGNPYEYSREGRRFNIRSLGADGQPGGEGEDADIDIDTLEAEKKE